MDSIIQELYSSGFTLNNDSLSEQEKVQKLNEYLNRHETSLNTMLNENGKDIFQRYQDCNLNLLMESSRENFISGFRLGSRIIMEIIFGAETMELQS